MPEGALWGRISGTTSSNPVRSILGPRWERPWREPSVDCDPLSALLIHLAARANDFGQEPRAAAALSHAGIAMAASEGQTQ